MLPRTKCSLVLCCVYIRSLIHTPCVCACVCVCDGPTVTIFSFLVIFLFFLVSFESTQQQLRHAWRHAVNNFVCFCFLFFSFEFCCVGDTLAACSGALLCFANFV